MKNMMMVSLLLLALQFCAGCSAGEFTVELINRSGQDLSFKSGEETVHIKENLRGKIVVSKAEGSELQKLAHDKVLESYAVPKTVPIPPEEQELLLYVGEAERLYLTDPSSNYKDGKLDPDIASKTPGVKIAAEVWTQTFHPVMSNFEVSEGNQVLTEVPEDTHYYRLVKVPGNVKDTEINSFIEEEFKTSATAALGSRP